MARDRQALFESMKQQREFRKGTSGERKDTVALTLFI